MLPGYAHTYVGVGGIVLNSKGEILVIQESYSELANYWKLPGGATDRGEELSQAAIREVEEETGLRTQFVSLLGVRHLQQYRWGEYTTHHLIEWLIYFGGHCE
jgi:ADP-ribose pyrophosphatase YjhB (NUDIX family)